MQMRLQNIDPHPLLKGYIEKMWLFESSGKMPAADLKLVVPNGHIKLSVAFQNGIVAKVNGQSFISKEQNEIDYHYSEIEQISQIIGACIED